MAICYYTLWFSNSLLAALRTFFPEELIHSKGIDSSCCCHPFKEAILTGECEVRILENLLGSEWEPKGPSESKQEELISLLQDCPSTVPLCSCGFSSVLSSSITIGIQSMFTLIKQRSFITTLCQPCTYSAVYFCQGTKMQCGSFVLSLL